jgi:hypothetical protein
MGGELKLRPSNQSSAYLGPGVSSKSSTCLASNPENHIPLASSTDRRSHGFDDADFIYRQTFKKKD